LPEKVLSYEHNIPTDTISPDPKVQNYYYGEICGIRKSAIMVQFWRRTYFANVLPHFEEKAGNCRVYPILVAYYREIQNYETS
jgi:hypothetical protein